MDVEHYLSSLLPGAILPSRLEWLCQPEQIEYTLALLFSLNRWKNASYLLLYADRQGLQDVQTLILAQAIRQGSVQAVAYVDGSGQFPDGLLLDSVAESAARSILIHLKSLCDPDIWPPLWSDGDCLYQHYIRPLYRRITGKDFPQVADALKALDLATLRAFLQERLQKFISLAKHTRWPLSVHALSRLCIAPIDLLPIRENRLYFFDGYSTWEDLNRSDLCKLDPEGASKVMFQYLSSTSEFLFQLPFRQAALFVSAERLRSLPCLSGVGQERGVYQGQLIGNEDGLRRSAEEILQDLGVDIASVCQHHLVNKQTYLAQPALRDLLWPTLGHNQEEWINDVWDGLVLPPSER